MTRKHAWTTEQTALIGTMPDAALGRIIGISDGPVRNHRIALGIPTFRSAQAAVEITCPICGTKAMRRQKDVKRSRRLYCSRPCANSGQKTRDSDTLRYGKGWKKTRQAVRDRDKVCQACSKPPEQGKALDVHHLVPFRFGGTNSLTNLVALCGSCHHRVEAVTTEALLSIHIEAVLEGSSLTISVDGETRLSASVRGADDLTPTHRRIYADH